MMASLVEMQEAWSSNHTTGPWISWPVTNDLVVLSFWFATGRIEPWQRRRGGGREGWGGREVGVRNWPERRQGYRWDSEWRKSRRELWRQRRDWKTKSPWGSMGEQVFQEVDSVHELHWNDESIEREREGWRGERQYVSIWLVARP
jgi:hypothetical protein